MENSDFNLLLHVTMHICSMDMPTFDCLHGSHFIAKHAKNVQRTLRDESK